MARLLQFFLLEVVMAAIEHQPLAGTYSVEVSGWDHSHIFFVERLELTWSEETGKLAHTLPQPSFEGDDFRAPAPAHRR